ncbi:MAG TPA: vanadium-dependent haloperoxidase [Ktedonobacteraceae bacterium]
MAKQNKQKHKSGPVPRLGPAQAAITSVLSTANLTGELTYTDTNNSNAALKTKPLPPLETESRHEQEQAQAPEDMKEEIPEKIRRRQFLLVGGGVAATTLALGGWLWVLAPRSNALDQRGITANSGDQLVVYWNTATLEVLHDQQAPLPVAARALSIVHTSMFDAWAAYDPLAVGTRLGGTMRRPSSEYTLANKCRAISFAAYQALLDLFPAQQERLVRLLINLKYYPVEADSNVTPAGIGKLAAQAVLDFRHNDGSNQLGNLLPGAYSDYTHYQPRNTPTSLQHPHHWQPLALPDKGNALQSQQFACAHWGNVTPFAIASAAQFVPRPGPHASARWYTAQATQILNYSSNLTQQQKVLAEYWGATDSEQIMARWFAFARTLAQRDRYTLDQNVALFFSLANAMLDTSIACWATKRTYDSAYPITAIHYLFKDKQIHSWAGPGKGVQWLAAQYWQPYQSVGVSAPTYPEYCSEQSAFSSSAAEILRDFARSDAFGLTYTQPAHSLLAEPDLPAQPVTLSWSTFSQAASQAGLAACYSGTHFPQSDLDGRLLGRTVAEQVWRKARSYISGQTGS